MTSSECSFFVATIRGLESFCADEIREKFTKANVGLISDSVKYVDSPGVVRFSTTIADGDTSRRDRRRVLLDTCRRLKSVIRVCALLDHVTSIPCEKVTSERTLELLKSLPRDVALESRWQSALDLWKFENQKLSSDSAARDATVFNPFFRVTCQRNKFCTEQKLNTMQVQGWLGGGIVSKYGWKVKCTEFELEVFASLSGPNLTFGVCLLNDLHLRNRAENCKYTTQLNPAMAYILARIACRDMTPTDVFCDPMCGVGTIPIEAASYLSERHSAKSEPHVCIGGDLCAEAVSFSHKNAKVAKLGRHVDFVAWDVSREFVRAGTIDVVCTDLPFGQLHKMHRALYSHFLRSLAPALKSGGKAYLLTTCKSRLLHAVSQRKEMRVVEMIDCDIGGFLGFLFVVAKDSEPSTKDD